MNASKTFSTRRSGIAGLLATGALLAFIVPAAAVGMPPKPAPVPTAQIPQGEMMALAEQPLAQAVAYCESRFRSYDRMTGTYLGYDGHEHACP